MFAKHKIIMALALQLSVTEAIIISDIPLLFYEKGRYHIETSPLICSANQWTDFYMITTSVMK